MRAMRTLKIFPPLSPAPSPLQNKTPPNAKPHSLAFKPRLTTTAPPSAAVANAVAQATFAAPDFPPPAQTAKTNLPNVLRKHILPLRGTQRARDDDLRRLRHRNQRSQPQRPRPLRRSPHTNIHPPSDGDPHPCDCSPTRQTSSLNIFRMITETAIEYRTQRLRRGSQQAIAEALGLQRVTITRRENGKRRVTREAMLALLTLPVVSDKPCRRNANPTNADSATAPAPRKSRDAASGSAAGATTSSNQPSTSVAQLKITRGRGGAITYIVSGE